MTSPAPREFVIRESPTPERKFDWPRMKKVGLVILVVLVLVIIIPVIHFYALKAALISELSQTSTTTTTTTTTTTDCRSPPRIIHADYTVTGSVAVYYCDDGYKLFGTPVRTCNDTGQWSDVEFSCCRSPPIIKNTHHTVTGSVAVYYCDYGYKMFGTPVLTCNDNGQWSDVEFSCTAGCRGPPSIKNTHFTVSDSAAVYYCDDGYKMFGTPVLTCNDNGHWSEVEFSCMDAEALETMRLAGRTSYNRGRVEVKHNGSWGTVCNDQWDNRDATVVCGHLGFKDGVASNSTSLGSGTGSIWMDNVNCIGNETKLTDCQFAGWGVGDCDHQKDAGVICSEEETQTLRLAGRNSRYDRGRVEIKHNGVWGTVCNDYWDNNDATVVCKQLGFGVGTTLTTGNFGGGTGEIWMDNVHCTGIETWLEECRFSGWGIHNCTHNRDAGVICTEKNQTVRLAGGNSHHYFGRVEIEHNGVWGTVCSNLWDNTDATVVCKQLGFRVGVKFYDANFRDSSLAVWISNVQCRGFETKLEDCQFLGWGSVRCYSTMAEVLCTKGHSAEELEDLRLAGSSIPGRGRVEVKIGGYWGTVCDDQWDDTDATVLCKQLGFRHGTAETESYFGSGRGYVWMDEVNCTGVEKMFAECQFAGWKIGDCDHKEDAGVTCSN